MSLVWADKQFELTMTYLNNKIIESLLNIFIYIF